MDLNRIRPIAIRSGLEVYHLVYFGLPSLYYNRIRRIFQYAQLSHDDIHKLVTPNGTAGAMAKMGLAMTGRKVDWEGTGWHAVALDAKPSYWGELELSGPDLDASSHRYATQLPQDLATVASKDVLS